ncbi:MAG TPA: hypothetical protein VFY73_23410 [Ideonella sp.]|uniref:hypothetical protein n=1 Tax=Ideonella sp. TaxID=1929293 RepID=UPI002E31AD23|nr:hypothetical protein [Ideonella sp.]HEX5686971.1 hypothetical protein [Ideonella sp.]
MNELPHDRPDHDLDRALDQALAHSLPAPELPAGFHARLQAALADEAAHDLARQRRELEAEHARQLALLQRGYVRVKRDTLAMVLAVAFSAGAVVHWALPWLHETAGIDLSELVPLIAVVIGLVAGASVWVERFGVPSAQMRGLMRGLLRRR